ncbi:MAG TPA: type I-U CRISPR-associated RAMP protein Csb1/Cas7u [Solirubrobacteraceae bacterium]|jgi:CRISPR-associated protein Csb1|nr:type I-U CRISPR-associated RAMP protein Csb1/Cas7u [Solirubrobacteraceae bacterium]
MATASTDSPTQISAVLASAVGGDGPEEARWASALRLRCRLQPAGGSGSKVMPPTYAPERRGDPPVYIRETRRIDGAEHDCVLLDGIASQANRIEDSLAACIQSSEIPLPTIEVDQGEFGLHSGLEFSHRCFDAWIEDAQIDGRRFGETELFKRLAASPSRHDLAALMETFPVGILLGCWASRKKNPQGTTRLARMLCSEIIAVDGVPGSRPASRIDRHHVSSAVKLLRTTDTSSDRFSLAASDDGKAPKGAESPSELGYGNVAPGIAAHGGITMDHALQIATVSMPALRECGFPTTEGKRNPGRDVAGRVMLTALALRMLALQLERGYDLRSGCLLVPEDEPTVELVGRLGKTVAAWPLISMSTGDLLADAIAAGAKHDLSWSSQKIHLTVSNTQLDLLRQSLAGSAAEAE